jgi:RND family efflux transporter MFP subunit
MQFVRIATVQTAGQSERAFTGVVSARVQSDLGFRVPGKVVERLVNIGDLVRRGQPLMRIDRTDLALAIAAQSAAVASAKARAVQTAADEARFRALLTEGVVASQSYDQAKAAADTASAQLAQAKAQAQVAQNEGAYSVLTADADGIVVETLAEPGQVVTAGQTVVKLAHSGPREAAVNLPETMHPALGSIAQASLYNGVGVQSSARLRQLSDSADVQTRTFEARYVLEGDAANAPLGATVTIRIPGDALATTTEVPLGAIYDGGNGPSVWILDSKTSMVSLRSVKIRQFGDETAILSDGVRPGERIVALGAQLLHDGDHVRVADDTASAR